MKIFEYIVSKRKSLIKLFIETKCHSSGGIMAAVPLTKPKHVIQLYHDVIASLPVHKTVVDFKNLAQRNRGYSSILGIEAKNFLAMCMDYLFISNKSYDEKKLHQCAAYFIESATKMPISDIRHILHVILSNSHLQRISMPLYRQLDIACTNKLSDMKDYNEILYLTDIWYCLHFEKSQFNRAAVNRLVESNVILDEHQYVHFMFLLAYMQPFFNTYSSSYHKSIEDQFMKYMKPITIAETGIISLGLHRNKLALTDPNVIAALFAKLEDSMGEVLSVHIHSLSDICKVIKKSMKSHDSNHFDLCSKLQSNIVTKAKYLDTKCYSHLISLGNDLQYVDERLLHAACKNFMRNIPVMRPKDLMILLFNLMNYNYLPLEYPNFLKEVCGYLHHRTKVNTFDQNNFNPREPYQEYISVCVYYLACLQYFDKDLLCKVFQRLKYMERENLLVYQFEQIYWLNDIVKLEGIQIREDCQLSEQQVSNFYKTSRTKNLKRIITSKEILIHIVKSLFVKVLGGKEFLSLSFIFPFDPSECLVFCTNKQGIPVPVPSHYYESSYPHKVKMPSDCDMLNWHAISVVPLNGTIAKSHKLKGNYLVQKRYMEQCNYNIAYVLEVLLRQKNISQKLMYVCEVITPFVDGKWLNSITVERPSQQSG